MRKGEILAVTRLMASDGVLGQEFSGRHSIGLAAEASSRPVRAFDSQQAGV